MSYALSESIEDVISRVYVNPTAQRGGLTGRLWWVCPFHADRNPSLSVVPGESSYHCFGCGAHGDTIDFVRRLDPSLSFRQAVQEAGGSQDQAPARERPAARA